MLQLPTCPEADCALGTAALVLPMSLSRSLGLEELMAAESQAVGLCE